MTGKFVASLLVIVFGLSPTGPGIAASAAPAVLTGSYKVSLGINGPQGTPSCVERWTFAADGTGTIESGEEVARIRYRVEVVDGDHWLIEDMVGTNGQPDCRGHRTVALPPERRRYFYLNAIGGFVLCANPQLYQGSKVVFDCYGHADPER